jgi:hypothetical protein
MPNTHREQKLIILKNKSDCSGGKEQGQQTYLIGDPYSVPEVTS